MKKVLFLLLLLVGMISCSKSEDYDPEITETTEVIIREYHSLYQDYNDTTIIHTTKIIKK